VWDKFCVQSNQFTKGGCSDYRTVDKTNRSHIELMLKHPEYVKLGTPNMEIEKVQKIFVNWSKAYNHDIKYGVGKLL